MDEGDQADDVMARGDMILSGESGFMLSIKSPNYV